MRISAVRVGEPGRHRPFADRRDVLQLDQADPVLEGVRPGAAVAGGAAVVDPDDRVAVVDPGRGAGREGVAVVPGRAAVDVEDGRERAARPAGLLDQRVDAAARAPPPTRPPPAPKPGDFMPGGSSTTSPVVERTAGGSAADDHRYSTCRPGRAVAPETEPGGVGTRSSSRRVRS